MLPGAPLAGSWSRIAPENGFPGCGESTRQTFFDRRLFGGRLKPDFVSELWYNTLEFPPPEPPTDTAKGGEVTKT
jgi:hypothetical protein